MRLSTPLRGTVVASALGIMTMGGAVAANAATYNPNPVHDGNAVTITSTATGLTPGDYKVSVCTTAKFGLFKVPACAPSSDATLNSAGQVVATTVPLHTKDNANAHYGTILVAQPKAFDCDAPGKCEVLVVKHINSVQKQTIESSPIVVLP